MTILECVPPFLRPLFAHMVFCRNSGESLFHNGAGKLCLLNIRNHVNIGTEWGIKLSTTGNSVHDWCGIRSANFVQA